MLKMRRPPGIPKAASIKNHHVAARARRATTMPMLRIANNPSAHSRRRLRQRHLSQPAEKPSPRGGALGRPDRHKPAHSPTLLPATVFGNGVPEITLFAAGVLPTQTRLPEIVLLATTGLFAAGKLTVGVFDDTSTFPVTEFEVIPTGPTVE